MMFRETFDAYVCEGDRITCEVDSFTLTACIVRDDCTDAPDQRQDGFWPSLYKDAAGFIGAGPNWRARFDAAQARAEEVMRAWKADEWFYCGLVLSVSLEGVVLDSHAASLWGIEANYPDSESAYLTEIAGDLLPEALAEGRKVAAQIVSAITRGSAA